MKLARRIQAILLRVSTIGALIAAGGCTFYDSLSTPSDNNPVRVVQETVVVPVTARPTTEGRMLREDKMRVMDALKQYHRKGVGNVEIAVPVVAPSRRVIQTVVATLRREVIGSGVPPAKISMQPYHPIHGEAPIILSFRRNKALPPQCGDWRQDLSDHSNLLPANFGCSVTANTARMAYRPEHLLKGAPFAPARAARAIGAVRDYYSRSGVSDSSLIDAVEIAIDGGGDGGGSSSSGGLAGEGSESEAESN